MLGSLMRKEVRLALTAPTIIFELFAVMMLIPYYLYLIIFFYGLMGIYFVCVFGNANRDVEYTALLPVSRADIVAARFLLCICLELLMVGLCALFAALRPSLGLHGNAAGMDPDAAFFGIGLLLMGIFNVVFFPRYYRNTNRTGIPFLIASLVFAAGVVAAEAAVFLTDFGAAPMYAKIVVLGAGAAAYAGMTWAAYRVSVRRFRQMNLNS